ncbi:hypothetical protein BC828DRAFT_383123 [Blastocladiella britannica]|nr:hypothetical protein BC828DRAFT_383123 [Blastocladiella britannica]
MVADPTRGPSATRASPLSMLASRIRDQSQWRRRQRAVLADVRMYAARLKRANVMAREIGINVTYQMHVDPVHARGANPSSAPGAIRVVVRVYDEDAHAVRHWSLKEFARRMPEMETLYAQSSVITAAPVGPRNPFVPGYTRALANVQVSPPATPTHQSSRSSLAFISGGGATSATDDEDDPTGHPPNDAPVADTSTLVGIARVPIDVVPLAGSVEGRVTVVSTLWYQTAIGVLHLGITRRPGAIDVSIMEMNMTARAGQLDAYRLAVRCHRSPTAWTDMMVGFALAESVPFLTSVTIALSSPSSASVRPPDLWIELHAQIVAPLRLWIDAELARAAEADAADALRSARLAAAAARPNSVTAPLGGTTATPTKQLVYANVQVQQLDELGFFAPVPVHQPRENLAAHPPLIRLRHGMIRRIQIAVYAPTDRPVSIASVELGSWRWLVPGAPPIEGGKSLALHKVHEESMVRGDLAVTEAQLAWDSSLHDFFYLNRPTTPTTASDAGMGGGGGGGGSGAGGGMPGGYLQATLGIHTTDGWVLSMQLAFVSTTRGVSGSSGGASAGSESAGMSGELRARSALGVWNVHRSPAHVPVAEYIRGEESLGSFHVLGTKDGGIGLVTGAVAHADWVNRLHEVERTRWWWWTMSRAPPAQQQPRARAMTPPSSGRLSVDSLAGIDSFANTPPHRLRPESRTSDMSDGTLLNTAVAEFLGANPAAAAVRAGFVSAPTSPVHRVFADAGTGPYSLVPPHTPPRPASVPPQTAQLGPGSLLPSAAGSANDLSPVKLPRDHPDAPVIRQQTALALWAQPPLAAVLPASARIRRVIGSGARARDHVTCEQVAGMPGVSRRGFLMMRDPRREPGTGSVVTTVKQQKQAVADAGEGAWIKMWVVIRRPFLVMYESAEEHIEVGFVHLSNAKLRECDAETEFTLEAPKFSYTFRAPSLQDVEAWIGSIDPLYVAAMQSNRRSLADVAGFPFGRRSPRHANGVGGSPGHTGLRERSSIANLAAAFFSVGRRMSSQSLTPP